MKYSISIVLAGFIIAGCTSSGISSIGGGETYMYKGINFGYDRDTHFKKGVQDACKTADGYYTKNHTLFRANESYRVGWEDGRLQCKGNK